ncbi:MAG: GldG family protein [Gammaproteobacteria bacterium]
MTSKAGALSGIRLNSLFMAGLLIVLAGLLAWLSTRYSFETDWTRNGRHTLSAASKQLLHKIDGKVEVTAYAREQEPLRDAIKRFIDRYQRVKPDMVLRFVNPDAVPDEVRKLGISRYGELVVHYRGRSEHVRSSSEQAFSNALQRLLRGSERWLAFIEGHGERNPLGKANHDLGEWGKQLSNRGFKLQPINLAQNPAIPDNTSVLIIAGPLVSYLKGEIELIIDYLNRGGNLLWLGDPGDRHGLDSVADFLGIEFQPGTIIDIAGRLIGIDDSTITLVTKKLYGGHPALSRFNYATLFPMATAVSAKKAKSWKVTPLVTSASHTWLERGKLEGKVGFDPDTDVKGPFTIALSLERNKNQAQGGEFVSKQQRIIVSGDGDFLSNTYIGNSGNLELGIRFINWLSRDDDFLSIPARTLEDRQFDVPKLTAGIIGFGFLIVLPLCLLATGGLVWWRRKNL